MDAWSTSRDKVHDWQLLNYCLGKIEMGYLENLKNQSQLKETHCMKEQHPLQNGQQVIKEKLNMIFQYLEELAQHLNIIQPSSSHQFQIPGVGDLETPKIRFSRANIHLKNNGYNFSDPIDRISFSMSYYEPGAFETERYEPGLSDRLRNLLNRHGIKYASQEIRDHRFITVSTKFKIAREIKCMVLVNGDPSTHKISFFTKNIERLGEQEFVFLAEDINETLLDDFAKFVIGENNGFRTRARQEAAAYPLWNMLQPLTLI